MEICNIVQEVVTKTISPPKKFKKANWVSEEAVHITEERREAKSKGEREDRPNWMQSSREQQEEIRRPS